jgi:hypothetical protein
MFCAANAPAQVDCVYKTIFVSRVQGRVFDPRGIPISFSVISLVQEGKVSVEAKTNEKGEFHFANASGRFEFRASAPGFASSYAFMDVGSDLRSLFHRSTLWVILDVGEDGMHMCPLVTTSNKAFKDWIQNWSRQK